MTSIRGPLRPGATDPLCNAPASVAVGLGSSGLPGVTTSTVVMVVVRPFGRVDVNVEVLLVLEGPGVIEVSNVVSSVVGDGRVEVVSLVLVDVGMVVVDGVVVLWVVVGVLSDVSMLVVPVDSALVVVPASVVEGSVAPVVDASDVSDGLSVSALVVGKVVVGIVVVGITVVAVSVVASVVSVAVVSAVVVSFT